MRPYPKLDVTHMTFWLLALLLVAACAPLKRVRQEPEPDPSMCVSRPPAGGSEPAREQLGKLEHLVVIFLENHSFDSLYGSYPCAEGLASSDALIPQLDAASAAPYDSLPQVDPNLPLGLPNAPFDITRFVPAHQLTIDLVHRFYQEQAQIDGGRMDRFVAVSDAKGLSLGYYPTHTLPLYRALRSHAAEVTLCDHFFHAAYGGSFLNHIWLIAAATPRFPDAPAILRAQVNDQRQLLVDGAVTADGDVVNLLYSVNAPHPIDTPPEQLLPNQTMPTIGDRLSDAQVSWAWYAGGWDDALAGRADGSFQFHHQPFVYFERYADGTDDKREHLKDERDFLEAVQAGTLPAVSFVKPLGIHNQHPGYADLTTGEEHVAGLLAALRDAASWSSTAVVVTYDENGGFWDHVPPPVSDAWGPGTRVPAIVVSPFARGGVDNTVYDTTAILKLIEQRWELPALAERDAAQASLAQHAFDFTR